MSETDWGGGGGAEGLTIRKGRKDDILFLVWYVRSCTIVLRWGGGGINICCMLLIQY